VQAFLGMPEPSSIASNSLIFPSKGLGAADVPAFSYFPFFFGGMLKFKL